MPPRNLFGVVGAFTVRLADLEKLHVEHSTGTPATAPTTLAFAKAFPGTVATRPVDAGYRWAP